MILEEETFGAFGYYPRDLKHKSGKRIVAACVLCGEFKVTTKHDYRYFCISCAGKGNTLSEEHKAKISIALIGRTLTEEHKDNLRVTMMGNTYALGCKRSKVYKIKQRVVQKGNKNALGCVRSNPTKVLMSTAKKDKYKGANNPNWQGGISFEPYCVKFNNAFKEYIRAKFGFKCFLCPVTQAENGRKLSVHHVNYNKNCGCDGDKTCQFVPLCISCHTKTNNNRNYWQALITEMLKPLEAWE